MPRVSVGLPVYNGENYLEEALQLLSIQTFEDFELIISDNGSTDRTAEICRDFVAQDHRVRYYREERNRGAAWNYNRVFKLATGELFRWASHDDLCAPTYLEECMKILDREPAVVLCYPRTIFIDMNGYPLGRYYDNLHILSPDPAVRFKQFIVDAVGRRCNAVFGVIRSAILKQTALIGNYNRSDSVLLGHLILFGGFYEVPEELFFRREHPGASARANPDYRDTAVWFDPANKGKLILPELRKFQEYVKCIMTTPIGVAAQFRCLLTLFKLFWWRKSMLKEEMLFSLKHYF